MKLEVPRLTLPQLNALRGDLVRVLTAPEYRRAVLAGAVAVLALGFWYFGIARPTATRVATLRALHEDSQREMRSLKRPSGAAETKARVTLLEARVRAALGRMSQDVQLVQLLKQLSVHAARYQIAVEHIDVKAAEGSASREASAPRRSDGSGGQTESEKKAQPLEIRTQKLELALSCSYEAAARFVDDLKTLPAFVTVDALKVERDASTFPNLKVLLTLKFHSVKQFPEELTKT